MPNPKPHHRRAATEALMGESGMKYAQLEYPGHLVRWDEDADSVPLTRVMGLRPEQLTRTAQAIADAEERGRQSALEQLADTVHIPEGACPLHIHCADHDFFHGGEAEEFREKLERLVASGHEVEPWQLQRILDTIDARDSLAYCERKDKERAALEGKP